MAKCDLSPDEDGKLGQDDGPGSGRNRRPVLGLENDRALSF